jgi:deoxyribodipyrimidine photolyase-related protein
MPQPAELRHLVIVLGDQLNRDSAAFDGFDPGTDRVWMAEVPQESTHVWSHHQRSALFLAAMRHFRHDLLAAGWPLSYFRLGEHPHANLGEALAAELEYARPAAAILVQPGDFRVLDEIRQTLARFDLPLILREDRYFFMPPDAFARWAQGKRELRNEHLYRYLRRQTGILIKDHQPAGARWNLDADNRRSFGRLGPGIVPAPLGFAPDPITRTALADVSRHFPGHPGSLDNFDWPVTASDARQALRDFIEHRLPLFGPYQDALWQGRPYLYHSRLAAGLNLHLISPRETIAAALEALEARNAPLQSVEGFVRQILGWREFVHGIYWLHMPGYQQHNVLGAEQALPRWYWTAETDMVCLREAIAQTLSLGYAHHIQRLMVTGLFALLLGVRPIEVHAWYLAVYVDAVEWVELPNTLGMSQYADGGIVGSKPYVASGRYIQRMSNYCRRCPYLPERAVGPKACPFTTLYWDFLMRHAERFAQHPRSAQQWRHLERLDAETRAAIAAQANGLREGLSA